MDKILDVSAEGLPGIIVLKVHIDAAGHKHIGREVIGIDKLLHVLCDIPSALVHILHMHLGIESCGGFHLTASVVVGSKRSAGFQGSMFRRLAVLHHIERERHISRLFGLLVIDPFRVKEIRRCLRVLRLRGDMRVGHIGVILLFNDKRGHGNIDHLPLNGLESQFLVGVLLYHLPVFVHS